MTPIGVALIGSGYIAHYHARALQTLPNVVLRAVCSVDEAQADLEALVKEFPRHPDAFNNLAAIAIDLPYPRRLDMRQSADFGRHARRIYDLLGVD